MKIFIKVFVSSVLVIVFLSLLIIVSFTAGFNCHQTAIESHGRTIVDVEVVDETNTERVLNGEEPFETYTLTLDAVAFGKSLIGIGR